MKMTSALALALATTAQCVVIATATCGNALVMVAVFRFKRMRTVANYFIASLAAADLAVALLVMPFCVVTDLSSVGWRFSSTFCHLWISLDVTCCTASILHICAIAVDRYLSVSKPLQFPTGSSWTGRRITFTILAIWTCSAAISFIPINLSWYSASVTHNTSLTLESRDTPRTECDLNANRTYAIVSSMTSFYLPLIVMVTVYVKIFCIARRLTLRFHELEKSLQQNDARRAGDWKATKTLGVLMGLFIICWLPFFVVYVARPFIEGASAGTQQVPRIAIHIVTWLGYANSAVNPFIYGLTSRDFRVAFSKLLLCHSRQRCRLNNLHCQPSAVNNCLIVLNTNIATTTTTTPQLDSELAGQ